jgi:hypothetical protein
MQLAHVSNHHQQAKQAKAHIPDCVFKAPQEYKTIEYREYRCHIPKTFVRRAGEGSSIYECKLERGMQVFIEVGE